MTLLFFIYYIFLFSTSILTDKVYGENDKYNDYNKYYKNLDFKENIKIENQDGLKWNIVLFSTYNQNEDIHKDFILYNFTNIDYKKYYLKTDNISLKNNFNLRLKQDYINVLNFEEKVKDKNEKEWNNIYLINNNFKIIKPLGDNYFDLDKISDKTIYRNRNQEIPEFVIIKQVQQTNSKVYLFNIFNFFDLIRNYFLNIFYIFGLLGFIIYYTRKNILRI